MQFRKIILFTAWFLAAQLQFGQEIKGTVWSVIDTDTTTLVGAVVQWQDSHIGVIADENGKFSIDKHALPHNLVSSFTGYRSDTIRVKATENSVEFFLQLDEGIGFVVVEGKKKPKSIDPFAAQNVEMISNDELLKAACCNLSESFETNASIDVSFNDAVTGSKQISLLGLDGVYSQINWENMPLIRGIGQYYGLSLVPGTWLNSIQIGKGAGSVINGHESMAGQINIEFEKPDAGDILYINAYQNVEGRSELNINKRFEISSQWSTGILAHGNLTYAENDHNADGFVDQPRGGQINLFNRWKYVGSGRVRAQFGGKYVKDERTGGQRFFEKDIHLGGSNIYGINIETDRQELFGKIGLIYPEKPYKSLGYIVNFTNHDQDGYFGQQLYNGSQKSLYSNFINQTIIGTSLHTLRYGGNLQLDRIKESYKGVAHEQSTINPGVFLEYNYNNVSNVNAVLGLRADHSDSNDEIIVSPRIHLKLTTDRENTVRLSAGRGFRTPTLFADNAHILASSRALNLIEDVGVEKSWNMGANINRYFKLNGKDGSWSTDLYRTTFQEQLIADTYSNPNAVIFSGLNGGQSYSNSFQTEANYELFKRFDIRLAYKRDDVKQTVGGQLIEKALTPKSRALINTSYALPFDRWKFDLTGQYVGPQRLPNTIETPNALNQAHYSDDYVKLLGQVTARVRDWEIYVGGENLTNFKQANAIIGSNDPFGSDFDSGNIWGPIVGRNIYAGLRFRVAKQN